jgi:hypothetical protein
MNELKAKIVELTQHLKDVSRLHQEIEEMSDMNLCIENSVQLLDVYKLGYIVGIEPVEECPHGSNSGYKEIVVNFDGFRYFQLPKTK